MSNENELLIEDGADDATSSLLAAPLAATPALEPVNPIHFEVMSRLQQLEEALLTRDPMMKMHLAAIHKSLIAHEELVHLLSDEQIGKIVAAQQVHTGVMLVQEVSSKAGKAKAANRTAKLGLDDL
jgi:hypothetical protein